MADFLTALNGGVITALVTPLNRDQSVDHGALAALCRRQLAAGVAGVSPLGSTGEGGLLRDVERRAVLATVVDAIGGRLPVMVGTGCQSTWQTTERQREALDSGASHGLVVAPFYCRPDARERIAHFRAVAAATGLPSLIYNVPRRTACDITAEEVAQLADCPTLVGLKDATGELHRLPALRSAAPHWRLFSGDDASFAAFVAQGGDGVISVASNVAPRAMVTACERASEALPEALVGLISALAAGPNPQTVKQLLASRGEMLPGGRSPLLAVEGHEGVAGAGLE